MEINKKEIKGDYLAYDGCHKIYIIEDKNDLVEAKRLDYKILPINELEDTYTNSCSLRFISNWKLNKHYISQFENADFTY